MHQRNTTFITAVPFPPITPQSRNLQHTTSDRFPHCALRFDSGVPFKMTSTEQESIIQLGVFADIQYANKSNYFVKYLRREREFKKALDKTQPAIDTFDTLPLAAVIHLGDIVDGNKTLKETVADFDRVTKCLSRLHAPTLHVLGNHCLSVPRTYLLNALRLKSSFYFRDISPKWRIIVLDTVEISVLRTEGSSEFIQALEYLHKHQDEPNAKLWNGGISEKQRIWLEDTLAQTAQEGKFAIVCGHLPLLADASKPGDILWEAERVVELLERFKHVVKAYFCGHCHRGGYAEKHGIHHVTFEGLVDSNDPAGAYAVVDLCQNHIVIRGEGSVTSRCLEFSTS